jgi:hypothetical protein
MRETMQSVVANAYLNPQMTQAREQFAAPVQRVAAPSLNTVVNAPLVGLVNPMDTAFMKDTVATGMGLVDIAKAVGSGEAEQYLYQLLNSPAARDSLIQTGKNTLNAMGAGFGTGIQASPLRFLDFAMNHPVTTMMMMDGAAGLVRGARALPGLARAAYDSPQALYASGLYKTSALADDTGAITIPGLQGRPDFPPVSAFKSARGKPSYDIGPLGDSRFTDAQAVLADGRTIKQALDEITEYKIVRGKKRPVYTPEMYTQYKNWWREWADANPDDMAVLWEKVREGRALVDPSMTSQFSPANALRDVMNDVRRQEIFRNPTPQEKQVRAMRSRALEKEIGIDQFSRREFGVPYKETTREMWQMYRIKKLRENDILMAKAYAIQSEEPFRYFANPKIANEVLGDLQNRIRARLETGGMRDEFGRPLVDDNLQMITYTDDPATLAELRKAQELKDAEGIVVGRVDPVEGNIEAVRDAEATKTIDDMLEIDRNNRFLREAGVDLPEMPTPIAQKFVVASPDKTNPNDIFIFGSNEQGVHGAGAARLAARDFAAEQGVGSGLTGRSYAFPTKNNPSRVTRQLSLEQIEQNMAVLLETVKANPDKRFFMSPVGTGLAGYTPKEISTVLRKFEWPNNFYLMPETAKKLDIINTVDPFSYAGSRRLAAETTAPAPEPPVMKAPLEQKAAPVPTEAELPGIEVVNLKKYSKQFAQNPKDGRWMMWRNRPRYGENPLTGATAGKGGGADMRDLSGLGLRVPETVETPMNAQEAANQARMISALQEGDSATIWSLRPVEGVRIEYIGRKWSGELNGNTYNFEGSPLGNPFKIGDGVTRAEAVRLYREYLWEQYSKAFKGERTPVFEAINDILDDWDSGTPVVLVDWCSPQLCHGDIVRQLIQWVREHPTARRGQIPGVDTPFKPLP